MLLDEFPTLRKMEFVSEGLRQMAGYGIKTLIVAQSFQDIEEHYGAKQTIVDNCHVLVCFAAADTGTAQRISQMTGSATELRRSFGRSSFFDATKSITYSESTRPLLMPGDVRELPYDTQLVFVTGHPPLRCKKVRHFGDPLFRKRLLPPPVQEAGRIDLPRRPPNAWSGVQADAVVDPDEVDLDDVDEAQDEPLPQWFKSTLTPASCSRARAELNDAQRTAPVAPPSRWFICPLMPRPTTTNSDHNLNRLLPARRPRHLTSPDGDDTFLKELFD